MVRMLLLLTSLLALGAAPAPLGAVAIAAPLQPAPALARIMNDIRANHWTEAETLAAAQPDRLVARLVTYYRVLDPGAASETEIATFMARYPDWPEQGILARRWNEALAADPDDATVRRECRTRLPETAAANARCAAALDQVAPREAARFARRAWIDGFDSPAGAATFEAKYAALLTPETNWARFSRLAIAGKLDVATMLLDQLPAGEAATARAFIALAHGGRQAQAAVAALTTAQRATPFLFFAELAAAQDQAARLALWQALGAEAEKQATGLARALLWRRRESFARDLLAAGDAKDAYALVAAARPPGEDARASRDFLAGFIALRMLHEPATARPWFVRLRGLSTAVITRARAFYWLAQTESGQAARADLLRAAAWPDTFYGQLAALQAGETPAQLAARIRALGPPRLTTGQATAFAERELPQAAVLLAEMGAPRRARAFLLRMAELSPSLADRYLDARLADGIGQVSASVMVARMAGTAGDMLVHLGWPIPPGLLPAPGQPRLEPAAATVPPPPAPPPRSVILSLIRQESSFDPRATSPSGAEGLMQLMPGTAREVARQSGLALPPGALVDDPARNVALGSAYFARLLQRFGDCLPLAIAAYNGGPRNVEKWIAANGDPRMPKAQGGVDLVTWIEEIPFGETRNYVERVTEGIVIYRALEGKPATDPVVRWTASR
ncbi:putative soluble lytic murein transglycosylase [Acidiphilium multivorum AIU301]|uniref:Putative soluble lytic murein transglycosylase n=1 Tax=Acidiphilium multivorum (strain DSM 11245 / JCM 8867 / NBRC 100883 / AIU 301) TaxID=926570 RepID=F0J0D9_ACIMA|nr:lytic transglycosylase domain-containing protein [Acidiphilium multivorum]BAJ81499.1 putative soluble lytic murein transglycosylase [Acidiphilium multivorum AIU301]